MFELEGIYLSGCSYCHQLATVENYFNMDVKYNVSAKVLMIGSLMLRTSTKEVV